MQKQNEMQMYENAEFGKLEILMIDDKPHFPATECAKILGYKDTINAIKQHCKGVVKHHTLTNGGKQEKNFIPEGDLYRLIIRSKLPEAGRFEKFVFDEVLPSIRKHGAYVTDNALDQLIENPEVAMKFFNSLKEERGEKEKLEKSVNELKPKARYYDTILKYPGAVQGSIIAKDYGMTAFELNKLLRELGVQYKVGETWLLYKKYADKGYTVTKTYEVKGKTIITILTCFTQRGRFWLYELLKGNGILPIAERGSLLK